MRSLAFEILKFEFSHKKYNKNQFRMVEKKLPRIVRKSHHNISEKKKKKIPSESKLHFRFSRRIFCFTRVIVKRLLGAFFIRILLFDSFRKRTTFTTADLEIFRWRFPFFRFSLTLIITKRADPFRANIIIFLNLSPRWFNGWRLPRVGRRYFVVQKLAMVVSKRPNTILLTRYNLQPTVCH